MIDRYIHTTTGKEHSILDLRQRTPDGTPCAVFTYAGKEAHERAMGKVAQLNRDHYRDVLNRIVWHVENAEGCTSFELLTETLQDIGAIAKGVI